MTLVKQSVFYKKGVSGLGQHPLKLFTDLPVCGNVMCGREVGWFRPGAQGHIRIARTPAVHLGSGEGIWKGKAGFSH